MPKDKKAKAAEKKARVAQKTEKKNSQKEKKASKKPANDTLDTDDEDDDLDSVLAAYAKQQEQFLAVTETLVPPPSARSSATLVASPASSNELFLYGGEYFNGALARFYNDLFVYNIRRDTWTLVTSPNTPLPRSGHAWTRGGNAGGVYLFGGEFSSPKQGTFYHYNDFWRFDPPTREWTKIETTSAKGSKTPTAPSARSGHRMTYYKQYIVLFGGFQDTSSTTKYLNDLWLYDTATFAWHSPTLPPASARPDARSSFSFLPCDDGATLYGGYSRVKASASAGGGKSIGKGGKGSATYEVLKPVVHQDVWQLKIAPPAADAPAGALPTVRWERRKRPVNTPEPARAGATMAFHKGRGILFGGVHDVEKSEEGMESKFFNGLFAWNVERNRCFALALRRPRAAGKMVKVQERGKRGRGKADEEALLENLRLLELREGVVREDEGDADAVGEEEEEEEEEQKIEKPVIWEMPHPRFNAQLTVQDDVLFIFGGTFEKAEREYTFNEMWSVDLGSLGGCKEIFRRELEDWQGEESESESGEEDEDEDGDEEDSGEDLEGPVEDENQPPAQDSPPLSSISDPSEAESNIAETSAVELLLNDDLPHPRPFESLRDFFARTSNQWQEVVLEALKYGREPAKSIKELRKGAFERAEQKWWDCREEIQALEDEQDDAGIGEVVNLADKAKAGSSSGVYRRR